MEVYKFTLTLCYDIEAEDDEDAVYQLVDLVRDDWINYADQGHWEILPHEGM